MSGWPCPHRSGRPGLFAPLRLVADWGVRLACPPFQVVDVHDLLDAAPADWRPGVRGLASGRALTSRATGKTAGNVSASKTAGNVSAKIAGKRVGGAADLSPNLTMGDEIAASSNLGASPYHHGRSASDAVLLG
jgi:hypothetical protein